MATAASGHCLQTPASWGGMARQIGCLQRPVSNQRTPTCHESGKHRRAVAMTGFLLHTPDAML